MLPLPDTLIGTAETMAMGIKGGEPFWPVARDAPLQFQIEGEQAFGAASHARLFRVCMGSMTGIAF